jgi:DUF2975 family protein
MTIRLLRLLLCAAMMLVAAGMLVGIGAVVYSASTGTAAKTTLQLRIDPARTSGVTDRMSGDPVGQIVLDRATLEVRAGGLSYAALQALDIVVTGGLWLLMLALTLRIVRQVDQGMPFDHIAVARLRAIGAAMIGLNIWMWLRMLAFPPVLLARINPSSGEYRVLPSIAQSVAGVRNARVDSDVGIGVLAAGMLVLVIAEAFRIGCALREDSESIV